MTTTHNLANEAAIVDPIAVADSTDLLATLDATDLLMLLSVAHAQMDGVRDDEEAEAYGFATVEDTQQIAATARRVIEALEARA